MYLMKFQLDTTNKTIKIEESVKLSKLLSVVKRMFPNGEWQDFTLLTNTTIEQWLNPIIYKEYYPQPIKPWYESPWICNMSNTKTGIARSTNIGGSSSINYELKAGTYNIEI